MIHSSVRFRHPFYLSFRIIFLVTLFPIRNCLAWGKLEFTLVLLHGGWFALFWILGAFAWLWGWKDCHDGHGDVAAAVCVLWGLNLRVIVGFVWHEHIAQPWCQKEGFFIVIFFALIWFLLLYLLLFFLHTLLTWLSIRH